MHPRLPGSQAVHKLCHLLEALVVTFISMTHIHIHTIREMQFGIMVM